VADLLHELLTCELQRPLAEMLPVKRIFVRLYAGLSALKTCMQTPDLAVDLFQFGPAPTTGGDLALDPARFRISEQQLTESTARAVRTGRRYLRTPFVWPGMQPGKQRPAAVNATVFVRWYTAQTVGTDR
jgi:hypothetical protein